MNSSLPSKTAPGQKGLRSACDLCHQGKVRCSGGTPCEGCDKLGVKCIYSTSNRPGRPKGAKNKKTLERIKQLGAANDSEQEEEASGSQTASSEASHRSAISRGFCNERFRHRSPSTQPSLPENQLDRNLTSPVQLWDFFPMPNYGHYQSRDCTPSLSGPCLSHSRASSDSMLFTSTDTSDDVSAELSWVASLLDNPGIVVPHADSLGHIHEGPQLTNQETSPIQVPKSLSTSVPQGSSFPTCNCVQQSIDQLANFKALSRSRQTLRPDFILTVARDSISAWQAHQQCPSCQHSDDKDILVLSAMALRALLNLIKETGHQHEYQCPPNDKRNDMPSKNGCPSPAFNSDPSFVGSYQLACEEKQLVVGLLLQRRLRDLNHAIEHLRQKSLRIADTTPRRSTTSTRSSRSHSSSLSQSTMSSNFCCGLPGDINFTGGMEELSSVGYETSLDEHDNYLKDSLQSSTETIESLLTTMQSPHMRQTPNDANTFRF